jgi:flagellar hook-length control protein FliK
LHQQGRITLSSGAASVASHISIIPAATGAPAHRGGATASGDADKGILGLFAAILGGGVGAAGDNAPTQQGSSGLDFKLGNLVDLSLGFGSADAQATAGPLAELSAALPALPDLADEFAALIEGLAGLKQQLESGEPIDPRSLENLASGLEAVASALNLNLAAPGALAGLPEAAGSRGEVTGALAPLLEYLAGDHAADAAGADLSAQIKAIGDKFASLLQSLNSDDIDSRILAALGLDTVKPRPALQAVISRLAAAEQPPLPAAAAVPLAAPALELTEPVLSGKPAEALEAAQSPTSAARPDEAPAQAAPRAGAPERDENPAPTSAPAAREGLTDAQLSTLTPHQASRADSGAAPRIVQPGYQTSQQQLNLPQLAFEVVRQVADGNTRFQIRLDPAELGRIDVKLDIDSSGRVNARLIVEKPETLDLMQRDQRGLERALQQAGLDGQKTNLEFSLKGSPMGSGNGQQGASQGQGGHRNGHQGQRDDLDEAPATVNLYRGNLVASGVNIVA